MAILIGTYVLVPGARPSFVREDGLVEQGTAVAYLLAGVFGLAAWLQTRPKPSYALLLVPLIGFLGFLDETSYGEKLFLYRAPVVAETEIDSAHDLLQLASKNVNVVSLSLIVPAGAAAMWILLHNTRMQRATRRLWSIPPTRFVFAAAALAVTAQIIDTARLDHIRSWVTLEEILEFLAATTMLGASAAIVVGRDDRAAKEAASDVPASLTKIGPAPVAQTTRRAA